MNPVVCLAILCGLGVASAATAQDQSSPAEIVVNGQSRSRSDRIEKGRQYIERAGVIRNGRQLARWLDPICVHVTGVDDRYAGIISKVIREVGAQAGVEVADDKCRPNIVVGFTDNGAALAQTIFKRSARSFSEASPNVRDRLLHGNAGIRWWYATEMRGSDGRSLVSGPAMAAPTEGNGGASVIPDVPMLNVYTSSLVATYGVRAITRATAIVDVHGATGLSLNTVAEYVALVVLAEIYPQAPPPDHSVLDALSGPESPKRLTTEDRAFLSAVYKVPLDRQPSLQRGSMAVRFAERTN